MKLLNNVTKFKEDHLYWFLFLRYTLLFSLLLISLASMALNNIIATESNPFFYANF